MSPPPERYIAPICVLGLRALLVADVVLHRPELQEVADGWAAVAWLSTGLAVFAYLLTVLADPGVLRRSPTKPRLPVSSGGPLGLRLLLAPLSLFLGFGSSQKETWDGEAHAIGSGRGAREVRQSQEELQPIGRSVFDAMSDCGDDPGEETIELADLESGNQPSLARSPPVSPEPQPASPGTPRVKRREPDRRRGVAQAVVDVPPRDGTPGQVTQSGHKLRFCKVCQMHQPLRTKHCRDCGHCVRTHDHHCPWIGTCVGEGNRHFFFWFLVAQFLELGMFMLQGVWQMSRYGARPTSWVGQTPLLFLGLFTMALLMLMVGCLLCFHVYLSSLNITTWENISWHNISYLSGIREDASPFSKSLCTNVAMYCCHPWCPRGGCGLADYVKRDEDGWIIWELGEPQNVLADLERVSIAAGAVVVAAMHAVA
eukprot:CAMPEP_0178389216 /NCGR_PEP_ID=MMETSP0689_2-20121128/9997_1 /TAXON_ID=160604 /ORGANISM="Amphidinium massartii, Strain CS-259" /LENGTH=426 /DNA_ID=CAMNT_0020009649 /DNA_START=167 /DNA_END=1444 /DNA_ORIENTATION=-